MVMDPLGPLYKRIKPLTGQVLVELLPPDSKTETGLFIPDVAQNSPRGEKSKPFKAIVVEIGPWPKTKQGYAVLPPFGIGATVLCSAYSGTKLTRNVSERLLLVRSDDVLAVLEQTP